MCGARLSSNSSKMRTKRIKISLTLLFNSSNFLVCFIFGRSPVSIPPLAFYGNEQEIDSERVQKLYMYIRRIGDLMSIHDLGMRCRICDDLCFHCDLIDCPKRHMNAMALLFSFPVNHWRGLLFILSARFSYVPLIRWSASSGSGSGSARDGSILLVWISWHNNNFLRLFTWCFFPTYLFPLRFCCWYWWWIMAMIHYSHHYFTYSGIPYFALVFLKCIIYYYNWYAHICIYIYIYI